MICMRERMYSIDARCSASSVRTPMTNGSNARASTGGVIRSAPPDRSAHERHPHDCGQMGKRDGAVEVDHRSSRSNSISFSRSRSFIIGVRGGGPAETITGGVTQPSRTPSARRASTKTVLRPACGGPNSATTRSRSVTNTISPPAAIRTYSLSLFLSTLRPTERIAHRSFQKLPYQFCGNSCQLVSRTANSVEWSGQAPLTRTDNLLQSSEFAAGG